jgi:hypothetical protein
VKLGFASLHSLFLLYTKLGEKANFDEVAIGEKISPSGGLVEGRQEGEQQNEKIGSEYVVARGRGFRHFAQVNFLKPRPRCAYCTKAYPL